jgi:hypothetical protein
MSDELRPLSGESCANLLAIHAQAHDALCPRGGLADYVDCPCGLTQAVVCTACGQVVFVMSKPNGWCTHAAELREPAGWAS